jgi:hypothetical protein
MDILTMDHLNDCASTNNHQQIFIEDFVHCDYLSPNTKAISHMNQLYAAVCTQIQSPGYNYSASVFLCDSDFQDMVTTMLSNTPSRTLRLAWQQVYFHIIRECVSADGNLLMIQQSDMSNALWAHAECLLHFERLQARLDDQLSIQQK